MTQSQNSHQQSGQYTQHFNTHHNPGPMINFSTSPVNNSVNVSEQQWKHFLTNISPPVASKLNTIGVLYILIAILAIGLDVGLLTNGEFSYCIGFVNGFFLFSVGVLSLIFCRQQVYVLTSLFVLVFFQLLFTIIIFVFYCVFTYYKLADCSSIFSNCRLNEVHSILIADLIHVFITSCIIIINLVIITDARRLPRTPVASSYVVYAPQTQVMPASFQNPCATAITHSSSA